MSYTKYSLESFGVILALQDGRVRLCNKSIIPRLSDNIYKDADLSKYKLTRFKFDPSNFHLKQPLFIWFELTKECNCRCLHCYIQGGEKREHELTTSQVFTLLEELSKDNIFHIIFTGGEPILRNDFIEIIQYASGLKFASISLITNGLLLSKELISQLPTKHLAVGVSLDGTQSYKRFTDTNYTYQKVMQNILLLKEANIPVGAMCNVTKLNIQELPLIIDWCTQNHISITEFTTSLTGRALENQWIMPTIDDVEVDAKLCIQAKESRLHNAAQTSKNVDGGVHFSALMRCIHLINYLTKTCEGGRQVAYITSEGNVFPCSNAASTAHYYQGNILQTSFREIWEYGFKQFREDHTLDKFVKCDTCEVEREKWICSGRCPVLSENLHGDPYVCGYTQFQKASLLTRGQIYREYGMRAEEINH